MTQNIPKERIAVALSGGVDSSVAAAVLVAAGFDVIGLFAKTWTPRAGDGTQCTWVDDRRDALRVAAYLGIPLITVDAEAEYRQEVLNPWIEGYRRCETPNPDVWCNRIVKFGTLLRVAREHGATKLATGHYAQIHHGEIRRGVDPEKDQTYFLWDIPQADMDSIVFPIGHLTKAVLRDQARALGLPVANKKDSQGICLLGPTDVQTFLRQSIVAQPGPIRDLLTGEVIGQHEGLIGYTLGQRHGLGERFSSDGAPRYVVWIDCALATLWVGPADRLTRKTVTLREPNWLDSEVERQLAAGRPVKVVAQVRYRQAPVAATLRLDQEGELIANLATPVIAPAPGQSFVCYDGTRLVGGAIIQSIPKPIGLKES